LIGITSPLRIERIGFTCQELAGERLLAPDATAARKELERVDGEEQPVLDLEALDELVHLFVRRAAVESPLNRHRKQRDPGGCGLAVDRAHTAVAELGGCGAGTLERA